MCVCMYRMYILKDSRDINLCPGSECECAKYIHIMCQGRATYYSTCALFTARENLQTFMSMPKPCRFADVDGTNCHLYSLYTMRDSADGENFDTM